MKLKIVVLETEGPAEEIRDAIAAALLAMADVTPLIEPPRPAVQRRKKARPND